MRGRIAGLRKAGVGKGDGGLLRARWGRAARARAARGLTHGDEDEEDAEGVEHWHDGRREGAHDVREALEAAEDADDAEHADQAHDGDGDRDGPERDEGQRDHDEVQDVPAAVEELAEPVAVEVQDELDGEHAGEEVVEALEESPAGGERSVWVLDVDLRLDCIGKEVLQQRKTFKPERDGAA